jgi:hypothetical protein
MKKRRYQLLAFLLVTAFLIGSISAEKIGIDIEDNFLETGNINFKITLYDDSTQKINGEINYMIQNPYSDEIAKGTIASGEKLNFQVPTGESKGVWGITANYNEITAQEKFNIGELKEVDIKLEQDYLVVTNIGNTFYDQKILIKIGGEDQTAIVYLAVGQTKKIRLTAPQGEYTVTVNDGTQEQDIVFSNVALTGNVVGLERVVEGGFWKKYPMVSLFLAVLFFATIIVVGLKFFKKPTNIKITNKNINKISNKKISKK